VGSVNQGVVVTGCGRGLSVAPQGCGVGVAADHSPSDQGVIFCPQFYDVSSNEVAFNTLYAGGEKRSPSVA